MKTYLLEFIKPYLKLIDNGWLFCKPFKWVYIIIGAIIFLIPFYVFYEAIDSNFFKFANASMIFGFIFIWLILLVAGILSFQLWWDRANKLFENTLVSDEFVATPILANLVQTFGEWFGSYIGAVGFAIVLISLLFGASYDLGDFMKYGALGLIIFPVIGYTIIIFMRYLAELMRAIAAIANNTKK